MKTYVLDACAVIALFDYEKGYDVVLDLIKKAHPSKFNIVMNRINLLEIYYDLYRSKGKTQAEQLLTKIIKLPIDIHSEFTEEMMREAGRIKVLHKMSLADTIVLAEAVTRGGIVVTADHHEFDVVQDSENIDFLWIR